MAPAPPLKWLVDDWLALIEEAKKSRHDQFGQYAEECDKFYDTAHNWMWKDQYARGPQGFVEGAGEIPFPTFQMTVNRVFEAVALFGPSMFQRYPQATVTPNYPPMMPPELVGVMPDQPEYEALIQSQQQDKQIRQIVASLKEYYLSWLQVETDKKRHARRSITEALVAGAGYSLTELFTPAGGDVSYPRSRHISWRQVLKDPDAKYEEDVQWIAIEWTHAINQVEEKFRLPPGSLHGQLQSIQAQSTRRGRVEAKTLNSQGKSFDLIKYYEIYSKNGIGDKLKKARGDRDLSGFGRYVRLVVAKGIHFPLNLPTEIVSDPEQAIEATQWPIPFWLDEASGGWPTTELSYYDKSSSVWPVSLFKPAIGWMRFINWCMSFLADKVAATAHDYIAVMKSAAKEIKDQLLNQKGPVKLIELSELLGTNINQVITMLDKPPFDVNIYRMVESALEFVDKTTGLTELVYGLSSSQMRSATEAGIRNDRVSVRPDDMTEKTEDWYSATMAKECMTAATLLEPQDLHGVLGDMGTEVFTQHVLEQGPELVVRDYRYRIAAGSTRKPNKQMLLQGLNDFGRVTGVVMQQFAMAGITEPWNAFAMDVAKALDLPDPERYVVQMPPPEQQGPSPEEVEAEQSQQKHEQELTQSEQRHTQDMEQGRAKAMLDLLGQRQKLEVAKQQAKVKAKASTNGAKK
jgi:hypothetical protein